MFQKIASFVREEEGLTAVEYAVAGGLITALLVALFTRLGTRVQTLMNNLVTAVGG